MLRASLINPYQKFYALDGITPLSGGSIRVYENLTTDLLAIYSDSDLTTPQDNPYTLDAGGAINGDVYFNGLATIVLYDDEGGEVNSFDFVSCFDQSSPLAVWDPAVTYNDDGSSSNIVQSPVDDNYYISIQDNNLNHEPSVSPLWWEPWFDYLIRIQGLVANNRVAVGDTTNGLKGIAVTAGHVVIGDSTNGIAGVNANAKGSLVVGNGTLPVALPVGTNTHVLTADSGQTAGVKWATVPSAPLVLLATLTPTAAANLDSLNTFSSTYDNYLIIANNLKPAADDSLYMQFAVAGSVVSTNSYGTVAGANAIADGGTAAFTTAYMQITAIVEFTSGFGLNSVIIVKNANGASGSLKSMQGSSEYQSSDAGYFKGMYAIGGFAGAAITGVRFFWVTGNNFAAQGSVRIYGIVNT